MELLAEHRKAIARVSFWLALFYCALGFIIYKTGKTVEETHAEVIDDKEAAQVKAAAHIELFTKIWALLSGFTLIMFMALFIVASAFMINIEVKGKEKQAGAGNHIAVLLWLIVLTTFIMILGRKIFGETGLLIYGRMAFGETVLGHSVFGATKLGGSRGAGLLAGGTMYFAALLFTVFVFFFNPTFKERDNDDGAGSATATSFACLFLSVGYLLFSLGSYRYKESIIAAATRETALDACKVIDDYSTDSTHNSGDFKRMDDDNRNGPMAQNIEWNHSTGEESARHVPGDFERMDDHCDIEPGRIMSTSGESANRIPGDFQSMDDGQDIEPGRIMSTSGVESAANYMVNDPTGTTEQGIQLT